MKDLTAKITGWFSRIAAVGILTAFILPVVSHMVIEEFVFNNGYELCTEETHTWFYLSEIVYLKSDSACLP